MQQILCYWVLGMVVGSLISVFAKEKIHGLFARIRDARWGVAGIVLACILGILPPLCMYGTIPVAASFRQQGMREDWLASFMMASILLNPQLIIYSAALGPTALLCALSPAFRKVIVRLLYRWTGLHLDSHNHTNRILLWLPLAEIWKGNIHLFDGNHLSARLSMLVAVDAASSSRK